MASTKTSTKTREKLERRITALGGNARDTGRKLWLAGLGTASSVESKSREVFEELVEKGRVRSERGGATITMPETLRTTGKRLKSFGQTLELRAEERASATLKRFGVPDRREVQDLIRRVELLTRKVENLAEARS